MKRIVALAALLCAAPSNATYEHDEAAIVLVRCIRLSGPVTGTAFKVGATAYITATHVVKEGACYVAGQPVAITSADERTDYATFIGPSSPAMLKASCGGFRGGQTYVARGYPGGGSLNIFAPWQAMRMTRGLFNVFQGEAIPGMSGGPVIDHSGAVVGVVNMRFPARSIPLSRTGYCKG